MRLHTLSVTAFQAFAGTVSVDFDALASGGLFLLHGETGAGKTTLLDAVCFALYGTVPGVRAAAARLRSDHAADDARTEVVLEATLSGRRVRIVRSPKQQRPKLRGSGTTEEGARVTLSVRETDGSWRMVADRAGEAEAEIADLVGLTCEQFCRVVLLPQGEFARFLHARDDERKALLEQLFATERFAAAQAWLGEQRKAAEVAVHRGLDHVGDVVSRAAQVAGDEPPAGWRDGEPAVVREWLAARVVVAQAAQATAEAAREAAVAACEGAAEQFAVVSALAERQRRWRAASEELVRWEADRPRRDAAERELHAARAAAPVAPLATAARAAGAKAEELARAAELAVDGAAGGRRPPAEPARATGGQQSLFDLPPEHVIPAPAAGADHTDAGPSATHREAAVCGGWSAAQCRAEAAAARERAGAVRALEPVEGELGEVEQAIAALEERAAIAREQAARAEAWLASAGEQRAVLAAAAAAAAEAQARRDGLVAAHRELERRHAAALERDRLAGQIATATGRLRAARDAAADARQAWLDAREARLAGIAAELAGDLRDGDPCRVCGATEHPQPASRGDAPAIDANAEQALERAQRAAQQAYEQAGGELAALEQRHAAQHALAADEPAAGLGEQAAAARLAAEQADALAATAQRATGALAAHEQAVEERRRSARAAAERASALAAERDARAAGAADARARVERARSGHATIAAHAAAIEAAAERWDAAAAAVDRAAAARTQHEGARAAAEAQATAQGFAHLAAAESAARSADTIAELAEAVAAHDRRLEQLRGVLEDPELAAAAQAQPAPLAAASDRRTATDAAARTAERAHEVARRAAGQLADLATELEARLEALAPLLERRALVRSVAGLADGSSPANRLHMPLGAYVAAARLEQVADAASLRLRRMSGGRYELAHCDARGARSRKAGLGLRVIDGWTGRDRPPASLSGGETFQASLALALGLADVVESEAGGVRLDTLFVDEGFGSLGERALDDVLDVLDGLREGGRAVGLISHVAELRQRVPTQLHVVQGRTGSTLAAPSAA